MTNAQAIIDRLDELGFSAEVANPAYRDGRYVLRVQGGGGPQYLILDNDAGVEAADAWAARRKPRAA